jgi:hypothetical protein
LSCLTSPSSMPLLPMPLPDHRTSGTQRRAHRAGTLQPSRSAGTLTQISGAGEIGSCPKYVCAALIQVSDGGTSEALDWLPDEFGPVPWRVRGAKGADNA